MASARLLAAGLCAGLALVVLSGCGGASRTAVVLAGPTPPDPPPIPARKPATPAGFILAAKAAPSIPVAAAPSAAVAAAASAAEQILGPSSYRVAPGDSVHDIAARFGVPLRALIDANRLVPPYSLLVGQRLDIPRPRVYQVAAGDTVYAISRRYGVGMAELVRSNGIASPYTILPGQKLVIPGPQDADGVQTAVLRAPAGAVAAEPLDAGEAGGVATRLAAVDPAAPVPQPPPLQGGKFLWPVSGPVVSAYGPKGGGLHNDGVNIAAPRGAPIRAAENGVVAYAGNELRGFGNLLLIKHSDGWVTAYAHAEKILVRRGQRVERGQVVARVGSSGYVSQPQLHFEVRKGVRTIDPARLLEARVVASN